MDNNINNIFDGSDLFVDEEIAPETPEETTEPETTEPTEPEQPESTEKADQAAEPEADNDQQGMELGI